MNTMKIWIAGLVVLVSLGAFSANATVIDPISATTNNELVGGGYDRAAMHTYDSSGMSPNNPVTLSSTQNTTVANGNMWESNGAAVASVTIEWDLGPSGFNLTNLNLWNYNEVNNASRGVNTADVQVSPDGSSWTDLGTKTFSIATGAVGDPGAEYPLVANGVRYVMFQNMTAFEVGGQNVGIAEIRFVGTALPEPASCLMCGLGAVALFMAAYRQRLARKAKA